MTETTLLALSLGLAAAAAGAVAWAIAEYRAVARARRIRREQDAWRATLDAWMSRRDRSRAG